MTDGAELRLATDDMAYLALDAGAGDGSSRLRMAGAPAADWRERPPDWPPTRYEEKALAAGRRPAFLRFRRRPPRGACRSGGLSLAEGAEMTIFRKKVP